MNRLQRRWPPGGLQRTLVIMVKVPKAGRVKTRLARGIGAVGAVQVYRHTTRAVLSRVVSRREWHTVLAVAPDADCHSRVFPPGIARWPQGGGDLGARLQRVMDRRRRGPIMIIGSDIPGITAAHIRAGFRALGENDAVFGPAPDGGYWLVGLKRFPRIPRAFQNVRWSSEHALADTHANLKGLRVSLIDELNDIDDAAALALTGGTHGRHVMGVAKNR
jgi:uncharacterized protein